MRTLIEPPALGAGKDPKNQTEQEHDRQERHGVMMHMERICAGLARDLEPLKIERLAVAMSPASNHGKANRHEKERRGDGRSHAFDHYKAPAAGAAEFGPIFGWMCVQESGPWFQRGGRFFAN